jgi:histidine triad (HIT) family protein
MDCVFCKIAAGEIPAKKLYETEEALIFEDIAPAAPFHAVVIPKAHIAASAGEITPENSGIVAKIFEAIAIAARENNLGGGYRVITNCGADAGQTVGHIHFHILGGKPLGKMCE